MESIIEPSAIGTIPPANCRQTTLADAAAAPFEPLPGRAIRRLGNTRASGPVPSDARSADEASVFQIPAPDEGVLHRFEHGPGDSDPQTKS